MLTRPAILIAATALGLALGLLLRPEAASPEAPAAPRRPRPKPKPPKPTPRADPKPEEGAAELAEAERANAALRATLAEIEERREALRRAAGAFDAEEHLDGLLALLRRSEALKSLKGEELRAERAALGLLARRLYQELASCHSQILEAFWRRFDEADAPGRAALAAAYIQATAYITIAEPERAASNALIASRLSAVEDPVLAMALVRNYHHLGDDAQSEVVSAKMEELSKAELPNAQRFQLEDKTFAAFKTWENPRLRALFLKGFLAEPRHFRYHNEEWLRFHRAQDRALVREVIARGDAEARKEIYRQMHYSTGPDPALRAEVAAIMTRALVEDPDLGTTGAMILRVFVDHAGLESFPFLDGLIASGDARAERLEEAKRRIISRIKLEAQEEERKARESR